MKFILGVIVVLGGVFALAYYGGGYASFDPTAQGKAAKTAIKPGMSWKKVADPAVAGPPRDYQPIIEYRKMLKPGPSCAYDANELAKRIDDGSLPNGFVFSYYFSAAAAFAVSFDSAGDVLRVSDSVTMKTLLDQ